MNNQKNPKSSVLLHHTRSFENLKSIIENGLKICYSKEKFGNTFFAAIPMVCFCDIPLSRIALHRSNYGSFAIGFNRRKLMKKYPNHLNPVHYIVSSSIFKRMISIKKGLEVMNSIIDDYRVTKTINNTDIAPKINDDIIFCQGYLKPFSNNKTGKDYQEYNQECEWRIVLPDNIRYKNRKYNWFWDEEKFDEWKTHNSNVMKTDLPIMPFTIDDINCIILDKNTRLDPFIIDVVNNLKQIGGNKIAPNELEFTKQKLLTKIRSFDEIENIF